MTRNRQGDSGTLKVGDRLSARAGRVFEEKAAAALPSREGEVEISPSVFFGERVTEYRKAVGLTQLQLANISGISQSHVSQLERGTLEPRLTTIMALATALQVDPALLMPKLDPEMRPRQETPEEAAIRERAERVRRMRSHRPTTGTA